MALSKIYSTEYGTVAQYWKITEIKFLLDNKVTVELSGYASEEARINLSKPIKIFNFTIPELEYNNNLSINDVYAWIKTQSEFSFDCSDC